MRARFLPAALALGLLACTPESPPPAGDVTHRDHTGELVVLVHGMGRTPLSMRPIARDLRRAGYRVLNWGYSSYCCSIAQLGARLQRDLATHRADATRVHFVGHSLGGILIRWVLTRPEPPRDIGNVVMLAPPNQGSFSADRYARWFGGALRPLPELTTDSLSTVRTLPVPPGVRIGIIAGDRDGKVTVGQSRLPGAAEHLTVPAAHTFLMMRADVRAQVLQFLETGAFRGDDTLSVYP